MLCQIYRGKICVSYANLHTQFFITMELCIQFVVGFVIYFMYLEVLLLSLLFSVRHQNKFKSMVVLFDRDDCYLAICDCILRRFFTEFYFLMCSNWENILHMPYIIICLLNLNIAPFAERIYLFFF